MIKRSFFIGLALSSAGLFASAAESVSYDRIFPQDTGIYLEMTDFARTKERWNTSPIGKAWETEAFKPIREKLNDLLENPDEKSREEWGNAKNIFSNFTGRAAFGLSDLDGSLNAIMEISKLTGEKNKIRALQLPDFDFEDEETADIPANPNPTQPKELAEEDREKLATLIAQEEEHIAKALAGFIVVAEVGSNQQSLLKALQEDLDRTNADTDATHKARIEEVRENGRVFYVHKTEPLPGVEIPSKEEAEAPNPTLTFVGETLIAGFDKGVVGRTAEALEKRALASNLSGNADYARIRTRLGEADMVAFCDMGALGRALDKAILAAEVPSNPMGITPAQIAKVLDLGSLAPAGGVFKLEEKGLHGFAEFGFTRETKLSKLLLPFAKKEADKPGFLPKDLLSFNSCRLDIPTFYNSLMDLATSISPMIGMALNMGLMSAQQSLGVDIKTGIIDTLGDSIVYAQLPPDENAAQDDPLQAMPMLYAIGLKDQPALQNAIRKISETLGQGEELITKSDYLGVPVYGFEGATTPGRPAVSYAFLGDYMVIGLGSDSIRSAIRAQKDPAAAIWSSPDLKSFMSDAPAGTPFIGYDRLQQSLKGIGSLAAKGAFYSPQVTAGEGADNEDVEDDAMDEKNVAPLIKDNAELAQLIQPLARVIGNAFTTGHFEGNLWVSEVFFRYADESSNATAP